MGKALHILYGCDDNYAPYTGISMTSLFENSKDVDEITVYLAGQGIKQENRKRFLELAGQYGRKLIFLDTDEAMAKMQEYHCQGWNGSLATWLRFFVLDQIPEDVGQLLWLDSDTIVCESLAPLCGLDMEGYAAACVCDAICYRERYRLGFGEDDPYFNAGVIDFNLKYWREHETLEKMFRHLGQNVGRYKLNDQDMLNDCLRGAIYKLPPQYNLQGFHLGYTPEQYFRVYPWTEKAYYKPEQIAKAIAEPRVVHFFRFLGDYPWRAGNNLHPAKALYEKWKEKSLWADTPSTPPQDAAAFRAEKFLYRALPKEAFLRIFCWFTNRGLPKAPV